MGVDLLVAIGAYALDGVSRQPGFGDEIINGPLPAKALVLDVAAVVRQHLDFDRRLGGARHRESDGTGHIMHTWKRP